MISLQYVWFLGLYHRKGRLQATAKLRGQTTSASVKCLKCSLLSTVYFLLFCNFSLAIYTKVAIHPCEINPHSFLYRLYMLLRRWKVKLDIFIGLLHCSSSFQAKACQTHNWVYSRNHLYFQENKIGFSLVFKSVQRIMCKVVFFCFLFFFKEGIQHQRAKQEKPAAL